MNSLILDFVPFRDAHSGAQIASVFKNVVDDFGIKDKVLAVCTDNASNNETFIQDLLDNEYIKDKECHIRCFAHVLNLAAQDSLKEIKTSIDVLRDGVKLLRVSPGRMESFRTFCSSEGVDFVKPILDVATRWNSTDDMLETGLRLKAPLQRSFTSFFESGDMDVEVSNEDWLNFDAIHGFLGLFKEATLETCGDLKQSLSYVVPWFVLIFKY